MEPLLELSGVCKDFVVSRSLMGHPRKILRAVRDASLTLFPGETLGIVGESGCGKTTLARIVLRLTEPSRGSVVFDGVDITHLPERELRAMRRHLQAVFQDPYSSLNPRMKVGDIVGEPLRNFGIPAGERHVRIREALTTVGLTMDAAESFPHTFSGGQRQRIGIARALVLRPKLIVCDEAVSALDVSVQAQVLNLLRDVQQRYQLALLFISHNLAVVRHLSRRIAVMYLGQIVELAEERSLFESPLHPYTRALLATVLEPRTPLSGEVPSPLAPPTGCGFRTRCPIAEDVCAEPPELLEWRAGHQARCHFGARL